MFCEDTRQPVERAANAGQHTPTLSLPPSHHCLNGEVYRGKYNVMSQLTVLTIPYTMVGDVYAHVYK